MSRWSALGRLAGSLALGAALGPYDYPDQIAGRDTRIALTLVVAPLFLALWLDRSVRRKALATLLLLGALAVAFITVILFVALGDRSPGLWFVIAAWLVPGTAAFTFGGVAPRISVSMKLGVWCGLLAACAVLARYLILAAIEPAVTGPCGQLHLNPPSCPAVHPSQAFFSVFAFFLLALGVVMAVFEGIVAVAARIWITRLASGMTLLGQPRGRGTLHAPGA